jgi:FeS assembly protein IscX
MTWDDYQALGEALNEAFPEADYMTISNEDLVKLVLGLPGFSDSPTPPADSVLSAIGFAWVAAAEGADDSGPNEDRA